MVTVKGRLRPDSAAPGPATGRGQTLRALGVGLDALWCARIMAFWRTVRRSTGQIGVTNRFPFQKNSLAQRMGEGANAVPCAAASLLKYTAWAVCRQFPKPFISQEVHDERQHELIGKI